MAKSKKPSTDYEVGYQKPPKETRFAKGQSGNPSGRPKGTRNFATIFLAALEQIVTINENGRQRKVTKLQAATMQLANKAAAGDAASMRTVLLLVPSMEEMVNKVSISSLSNAQDRMVLNEFLKSIQAPSLEVISLETPNKDEGASS